MDRIAEFSEFATLDRAQAQPQTTGALRFFVALVCSHMYEFFKYALYGGRSRWFRRTAKRLARDLSSDSQRLATDREAQLFGEVVRVGLRVAPEDVWELYRSLV